MKKRHIWTPAHQARLERLVDDGRLTVTLEEAVRTIGFPQFPLWQELERQRIKRARPGPKQNAWSSVQERQLRDLVVGGVLTVSAAEAAERTGAGTSTIYSRLRKMGVRARGAGRFRFTPGRMAVLRASLRDDMSLAMSGEKVSEAIGCTMKQLSQKLWKMRRAWAARQKSGK